MEAGTTEFTQNSYDLYGVELHRGGSPLVFDEEAILHLAQCRNCVLCLGHKQIGSPRPHAVAGPSQRPFGPARPGQVLAFIGYPVTDDANSAEHEHELGV